MWIMQLYWKGKYKHENNMIPMCYMTWWLSNSKLKYKMIHNTNNIFLCSRDIEVYLKLFLTEWFLQLFQWSFPPRLIGPTRIHTWPAVRYIFHQPLYFFWCPINLKYYLEPCTDVYIMFNGKMLCWFRWDSEIDLRN